MHSRLPAAASAGLVLLASVPAASQPLLERGETIGFRRDIRFLSSRDGIGVSVYRGNGFSVGPLLRHRFGRDQDDNDALKGLGEPAARSRAVPSCAGRTAAGVVNVNAARA